MSIQKNLVFIGWSAVLVVKARPDSRAHVSAISHPSSHSSPSDAEACMKQWRKSYSDLFDVTTARVYAEMDTAPGLSVDEPESLAASKAAFLNAWATLPDSVRCHPGVKNLYVAVTGKSPTTGSEDS